MFLEHASRPLLQPLISNALQFNMLLKELLSSSLIRRTSETRTLGIHRLVQTVLKGQLDESLCRQWAEQILKIGTSGVSQWSLAEQTAVTCSEAIVT